MKFEYKAVILLVMLFCHIVDDYYLQGVLASMKQRVWWVKNYPQQQYDNDFLMALMEHAFSWTFFTHLSVLLYMIYYGESLSWFFGSFVINWMIHALVDNLKANHLVLNLVQDQFVHIVQIVLTWLFLVVKVA